MQNNVICMKWGSKFGADYVNKLYSMVARNLSAPFKFVCFTDDSSGIRAEVETRALPEMKLPSGAERGWRKLSTFKTDIGLEGRVLFLDLDIVIVGSIDRFFEIEGNFIIAREFGRRVGAHGRGNSSVYRFEAGTLGFVYENFINDITAAKNSYRHEQAYLTDTLFKKNMLKYWPEGWCVSFKHSCARPFPLCYFQTARIPEGAKIVIFHGKPTPEDAEAGILKVNPVKRFFRHLRPVGWIGEYRR